MIQPPDVVSDTKRTDNVLYIQVADLLFKNTHTAKR